MIVGIPPAFKVRDLIVQVGIVVVVTVTTVVHLVVRVGTVGGSRVGSTFHGDGAVHQAF